MTNNRKINIIKHLQTLKSFGIEYIDDIDISLNNQIEQNLPDDMEMLLKTIDQCTICELCKRRKNRQNYTQQFDTKVMFVADFMTSNYDDPFMGQAGLMLKNICQNVLKIKTDDIYFTTILKCPVKNSSDIQQQYIDSCKGFLEKQIEIIKPKVIVVFENKTSSMLEIKAKNVKIIKTYSPTMVLKNQNLKQRVFDDMKKVKHHMEATT
ncbi:MAG: hypothetical protein B1H07_00180 [Campylobacteraceae bacterium 4484_166]|nr:MAG: hypothetical protein B1H07_00180 [Campylobacteraceae bacterium 4484_166]